MPFEIKKASRAGVKPLIGIYGESGTGKTMSALLLARGLAGAGKVILIDSESGRGSLYSDVIPSGYDTLELREPFSPARYIEAIQAVEATDAAVLVIDSASHEHEGIGGVLDMANENEVRSGKAGLHNWKVPKMEHAKFMLKMLQSKLPIIVCLRAKYKTRQAKGTVEMAESGAISRNQVGKTVILKDEKTSPIAAEDFIFEMVAHMEILQDHSIVLTKVSHPSLRDCFPKDQTEPISGKHGELLAAWCNAAGKPLTNQAATPPAAAAKKVATEATRNWMLEQLKDIHPKMLAYGIDKAILLPTEPLDAWPLSKVVMSKTELAALRKEIEAHQ